MNYTSLVSYFFIYSILGWVIEEILYVVQHRKFAYKSLLFGPWNPIYGLVIPILIMIFSPLSAHPILIILLSIVLGVLFEGISNYLIEYFFDMHVEPNQSWFGILNGRITLVKSLLYGIGGYVAFYFVQPYVGSLVNILSHPYLRVLTSMLTVILLVDLYISIASFFKIYSLEIEKQKETHNEEEAKQLSYTFFQEVMKEDKWFSLKKEYIEHTYPNLSFKIKPTNKEKDKPKEKSFASGLGFYKYFWIFVVASVLGFFVETIWSVIVHGHIESRQGLIYGPFSQVYGIAAVAMTAVLTRLLKKGKVWVFFGSAILGGAVEVVLSYLQQKLFGSVSWYYGKDLLGICGGRTSLIYMLFWGALGLFFIIKVYPPMSRMIEDIPNKQGLIITWLLVIFLIFDASVSAIAVYRWNERLKGVEATNQFERAIDKQYPNKLMKEIYPNMDNEK